jgi:hypothetical protein
MSAARSGKFARTDFTKTGFTAAGATQYEAEIRDVAQVVSIQRTKSGSWKGRKTIPADVARGRHGCDGPPARQVAGPMQEAVRDARIVMLGWYGERRRCLIHCPYLPGGRDCGRRDAIGAATGYFKIFTWR